VRGGGRLTTKRYKEKKRENVRWEEKKIRQEGLSVHRSKRKDMEQESILLGLQPDGKRTAEGGGEIYRTERKVTVPYSS